MYSGYSRPVPTPVPASLPRASRNESFGPLALLLELVRLVALWRRRARTRAELSRLDARTLRDIGLEPGDVRHEMSRPFWK